MPPASAAEGQHEEHDEKDEQHGGAPKQAARHPGVVPRLERLETSRTGVLVLTKRRLLFLGGGRTEIPVGEIQSVRADKWFNGNYRNGVPWMILTTERTGEVGFMTGDGRDGWTDVVRGAMAKG